MDKINTKELTIKYILKNVQTLRFQTIQIRLKFAGYEHQMKIPKNQ